MFTDYKEQGFNQSAYLWLPLERVEAAAMEQIREVCRHPEIGAPLAIMPDCHKGYGVTIGSVLLTKDAIMPNAVGVDIGCGMGAVRTLMQLDPEEAFRPESAELWHHWAANVRRLIPVGFNSHERRQPAWSRIDQPLKAKALHENQRNRAPQQLGTLGGGNHFLEAQLDEEGFVWVMVHSGSRRIGLDIAKHYHTLAKEQSYKRRLGVIKDLSTLSLDSKEGVDYAHDMDWAIGYAFESRRRMLDAMLKALEDPGYSEIVTCAHNYAEVAWQDGMAIHRKGATSAAPGQAGLIPGSMGSNSYVVEGLGHPASHQSCSHGAGRTMGRMKAKELITGATKEDALANLQSYLVGTHTLADLSQADESPLAYKDIDEVMANQTELVTITHTLRPLITVKGGGRDEG